MFKNRLEAGNLLAEKLQEYTSKKNAIVLAIPRGGLQIGVPIAKKLDLPLDIVITKKIPFPGNPEYAIGAIGPEGEIFITSEITSKEYINEQKEELTQKIKERYKKYRGNLPLPNLKNKIVILVDDGLATGSTMIAAIAYIKKQTPSLIIVAVPVAPMETCKKIEPMVDKLICLKIPEYFYAVGEFYQEFFQVEDDEAIRLLKEAQL